MKITSTSNLPTGSSGIRPFHWSLNIVNSICTYFKTNSKKLIPLPKTVSCIFIGRLAWATGFRSQHFNGIGTRPLDIGKKYKIASVCASVVVETHLCFGSLSCPPLLGLCHRQTLWEFPKPNHLLFSSRLQDLHTQSKAYYYDSFLMHHRWTDGFGRGTQCCFSSTALTLQEKWNLSFLKLASSETTEQKNLFVIDVLYKIMDW